MDALINVIKKNPKVRIKINDMLDRYNRFTLRNQSKIGYDTLIQNVLIKELLDILGTTITALNIELTVKISRIKYLESKLL